MITTAMINKKTANVFRQVWSSTKDCRESCNICSGMGLKNSAVALPGATTLISCNFWSMRDLQPLDFKFAPRQTFLVPGKYLLGGGFLKVLETIPKDSRLILILDRDHFDSSVADQIREQFESEIWVVPTRVQKTEALLQKISELKKGLEKTYLYSPTYSSEQDQFFTTNELYKVLRRVKKRFPRWNYESPPGLDLHNPTLDQGDLIFDHEILFNSSVKDSYKVSVIIPSFENTDYVLRVLSGLARQSEGTHNFEVIVVDDGSRPIERDRLLV
ncbi:MAG: glycosyltransferase, partial [Bdellovibrionales bacterium]|nr:glycosyltransferase [Bdellovibrionales bacterium]